MTIEGRVPLNEVKSALHHYSCLYNTISNATGAFTYKKKLARNTFLSLVFFVVKIFLLFHLKDILLLGISNWIEWIGGIIWIYCCITIFFDLFYIQKIEGDGKTRRRLRFRPLYFIKGFMGDIIEMEFFKKKFHIMVPAFSLIFGLGNKTVYSKLSDWAIGVAHSHAVAINQYEAKYTNYRDYVDLWQHFSLCGELLEIINSGRATDIQGALAVVDVRRHRQRLENIRRQEMEATREAMDRMASAREREASAVASAASQFESESRAREDYYRGRDW